MATITRGSHDVSAQKVKDILDDYEREHSGAAAEVFRLDTYSIWIRIIDERFKGWSRGKRHHTAWPFIADRLTDDEIQEVAFLLLLSPDERPESIMSAEFDNPMPSVFGRE
jgi:hypothetical protein